MKTTTQKNLKALFYILIFACAFSVTSRGEEDPIISTVNVQNRICKSINYLLHLPQNKDLLKNNIHTTTPDGELPQDIPNMGREIHDDVGTQPFYNTDDVFFSRNAPAVYQKINRNGQQARGIDYNIYKTQGDVDMDKKDEKFIFVNKKGLPDFGKLYLASDDPPLAQATERLNAVGLMFFGWRSFIATRGKGTLGIYALSSERTPGHIQPAGNVKVELLCYFADTTVTGLPDAATHVIYPADAVK